MNARLLLSFFLLSTTPLLAQFRYTPERPQPGDVVSFTYTPNAMLASETTIEGRYVRYGSPLVMRLSQPETATAVRVGNSVIGEVKVPKKDVAGFLMAFQSKAKPALIDHNNTHFYPILLHTADGNVQPHATGGQASVMVRTAFPYAMKIKPDWAWTVGQYERELQQHPTTRPLYWADLILAKMRQAESGPATSAPAGTRASARGGATKRAPAGRAPSPVNFRQTALTDIATYLDSQKPAPSPADLTTAAQLYDQLNEPKLAQQTRDRIKTVDPAGDAAQKARAEAVRAEPDLGRKLTAFSSFTQAFPTSAYRAVLVSSVAEAYFKPGQFKELVHFLTAQPVTATDPALLLSFAQQMAEEGRGLPQAEWIANRAIAVFRQVPAPRNSGQDRVAQIRAAQAALGHALEQQNRLLPALTAYREAATSLTPDQTDVRTNERTWLCAQRASRADSVLPFIESVVREGRATPRLRSSLIEWQTPRLGGAAQATTYLRTLEADYRADRRAELAEQFVNQPAPGFTLTTLDGKTVSLAGLRGKVVVLDFWATWCGPCVASFPAMRQARDYFKNDPNVQFLFVNTREGGPVSRVQNFVARQPYTGVIPLDLNQRVSDAYGVQGIPTKVIIDPKGRVRYRSIGYSGNAEATADELTLVIEALKEM
ncbi:Thiol-disulfide oxidoreductase resA [Fibrella aestuarina BUZ 2]|uniref:Thiol-disulfide oxidoreductase resA n=1 Tax=Fibrella aestuarina BUZ 2 TaxID=1166018 RepID=I0KBI0_9BACT|nr:TlpA disulfide reductase family protein [Fibrella aestuarina]CCH01483.1 Thiol-disulfide oxidoreductase resA [Fibrella aestuarina BUZ 2]